MLLSTAIFLVLAADQPGLRARGSEQAYPGYSKENALSIGAEMLSAEEVRNTFATDLNRGFLVLEVGVFPAPGKSWNLNIADFSLRIGADKIVRPVTPNTISAILQRKSTHSTQSAGAPNDITVYPSGTIGYESGGGLDPYGRSRRGGWVTGAGVGVGMGGGNNGNPMPPPAASTDVDRSTMQMALQDKALPQGEATQAVAGYLYFPLPADQKKSSNRKRAHELVYQHVDSNVRVNVPNPK